MITREDIQRILIEQPDGPSSVMKLIESDQAKYTALVDAAVACAKDKSNVEKFRQVHECARPFMEILLSEELDKLADKYHSTVWPVTEIRRFADKARALEEK